MEQLLNETIKAALKLFPGLPIRVWYVKVGERSWKAFVINVSNKIVLAKGAVRASPEAAVNAVKIQFENIVGRSKTS